VRLTSEDALDTDKPLLLEGVATIA
jgi:hypothetical protein